MSSLTVYHQSSPQLPYKLLNDAGDISSTLAAVGVRFEHFHGDVSIKPGSDECEVVTGCKPALDQLMIERGYEAFDVVSADRAHPLASEQRTRLLEEHRHDEDELCWFVAGRGLVSLHIEDEIYTVLCERNDLLMIPAGFRRWFDFGDSAHLVLIRLFRTTAGRQAAFTGDAVSSRFPRLDD